MTIRSIALALVVLFAACAAPVTSPTCGNAVVAIDAQHAGGDLDRCSFRTDGRFELEFTAEDASVDGAFSWFSFHVTAVEPTNLELVMRFPDSYARFWPKLSRDGRDWDRAAAEAVRVSDDGKTMYLGIGVDPAGLWVSAQELVTGAFYDDWIEQLATHEELSTVVIGTSVEGRPIRLLRSANKAEAVILIGRQHPTEVPGTLAMHSFVEVVMSDTELARRFRDRFALFIVPLVNPDGVANGNARHNAGGVDLNRDWGPFTQPETKSIARVLDDIDALALRPRLMLDFHATRMTPTMVFYTQVPEDDTDPPLFATKWLTRVDQRLANFEFTHDPRTPSGQANAKNYFFSRYGIPSITYEIGDETDRQAIRSVTPIFAEEMMKTLLEAE